MARYDLRDADASSPILARISSVGVGGGSSVAFSVAVR